LEEEIFISVPEENSVFEPSPDHSMDFFEEDSKINFSFAISPMGECMKL